ncbi:MAG: toprim domain-containing protein [Candidatus Thorarchaeota archaeon]
MDYRSDKPLRDNERALVDILSTLEEKYESILVVVEGKRDERVLRNLGFSGKVIRTQTQSTRVQVADQIALEGRSDSQVLILTDFDTEGIQIAKFLEQELELRKVPVLKGLRLRIRNVMGNWRCIEELVSLFKRKDSPQPE